MKVHNSYLLYTTFSNVIFTNKYNFFLSIVNLNVTYSIGMCIVPIGIIV